MGKRTAQKSARPRAALVGPLRSAVVIHIDRPQRMEDVGMRRILRALMLMDVALDIEAADEVYRR